MAAKLQCSQHQMPAPRLPSGTAFGVIVGDTGQGAKAKEGTAFGVIPPPSKGRRS